MVDGRAELGGNDSGENFVPKAIAFTHIRNSKGGLELSATSTQLSPTPERSAPGDN